MAYVPYSNYVHLHLSYVWAKQMGVIRGKLGMSDGLDCQIGNISVAQKITLARAFIWHLCLVNRTQSRWQRPRSLRGGSAAALMLGLWVRIPPGAWMSVSCECCVLSGRGLCVVLITRPEECYRVCLTGYDHESSIMRRPKHAVAQLVEALRREVAVSILDGVIGIFDRHNPSPRTMVLGST